MKREEQKNWSASVSSTRCARIAVFLALLVVMLLFNVAAALAQLQSHKLSETRVVDTNLNMGAYQINTSRINATTGYFTGNVTVGDSLYVKGGIASFNGIPVPLSVGNGSNVAGVFINASNAGIYAVVDNASVIASNFGGGVIAVNTLASVTGQVRGTLANWDDTIPTVHGWSGVTARYKISGSNNIDAFLANGSIAVYGSQGGGVHAGYFVGNVSVTQNLSVGSNICLGGVCRSTWPAGGAGGGGVNGSGVSGRLAVWNDTDKINSSGSLVWDFANSRMGIRTANPSAAVDVQGGTVLGNASGAGILVSGAGVYGTGSTYGLYGRYDTNNYGYVGNANTGVFGQGSSYGVFGYSSASFGVYGESASSYGVFGLGSPAVYGQYDASNYGYLGSSTIGAHGAGSTAGVVGNRSGAGVPVSGSGVYGTGSSYGVYGQFNSSVYGYLGSSEGYGVRGNGTEYGVYGTSSNLGVLGLGGATGVAGQGSTYGVIGFYSADPSNNQGYLGGPGVGVFGRGSFYAGYFQGNVTVTDVGIDMIFFDSTNKRIGVNTSSPQYSVDVNGGAIRANASGSSYAYAVEGYANGTGGSAVYGQYNSSIYGIMGADGAGGVFINDNPDTDFMVGLGGAATGTGTGTRIGVWGNAVNGGFGYGVRGTSSIGYGVYGEGSGAGIVGNGSAYVGSMAGYFVGNVNVTGNLTVGTGTIFLDGKNNRIGINTTTPEYAIDVRGGTIAANVSGGNAQMAILGVFNNSIGGYIGGPNKAGVFLNTNPSAGTMYGVYTITNGTGTGNRYGVWSNASNGNNNYGVYATSSGGANSNYGIYASAAGTTNTFAGYFIYNTSVLGYAGSNDGKGLYGRGTVYGVQGDYNSTNFGYVGSENYGVYGTSANISVYGVYNNTNFGYLGSLNGYGVYGQGDVYGVYGYYDFQTFGMLGAQNGAGVEGHGSAYGIYGASGAGYAGFFDGKVWVGGGLNVTGLFQLQKTDAPAACSSAREGSVYYDDSQNRVCYCNGTNWCRISDDVCNDANGCG